MKEIIDNCRLPVTQYLINGQLWVDYATLSELFCARTKKSEITLRRMFREIRIYEHPEYCTMYRNRRLFRTKNINKLLKFLMEDFSEKNGKSLDD
jgi:hypothetical protein